MIVFVSSDATGKVTQHGLLAGNGRRKGTGLITEKILGFKVNGRGQWLLASWTEVGQSAAPESHERARRPLVFAGGESSFRTKQKKVPFPAFPPLRMVRETVTCRLSRH